MNPLKIFNLEIEKINEKEVLFGVFHIEDKDGVWKNYETRGEKRESEKREGGRKFGFINNWLLIAMRNFVYLQLHFLIENSK